MRSFPRLLAGVAAVAAVSLLASGCDTSPVAASVNGQLIKETALDAELQQLSANPRYIAAVESSAGAISNGPGTYTTGWTADVLTQEITGYAVHQYLARRGDLPTPAMLTVARTVESADYSDRSLWQGFPASYRTTLTQRTADLATLEPPTAPSSQLAAAYRQYRNYFFTSVCVRTAAIQGSSYAAARGAAAALVSSGRLQGSRSCYTPEELEGQSASFVGTVVALAVGKASIVPNGFGAQVTQVVSRTSIPLAGDLSRALSSVIELNSPSPVLARVLARADVRVDPAYGTWSGSASTGFDVHPPVAPRS